MHVTTHPVPEGRRPARGGQWRRGTRTRRAALALSILAVLVAMAGCAASRPSRAAGPPAGGTAQAAARAVLGVNFATLRWAWYLGRAEQVLTAQCMQALGFQYTPPVAGPEPSARSVTAYALGTGYPATYGVTQQSFPASNPHEPGSNQRRYEYALDGPATSTATIILPGGGGAVYGTAGCIGFAREKLFGSVHAYMESALIPQTIRNQFGNFLSTYRPYRSALQTWQHCMKARGWKFAGPQSAIESVQALAVTRVSPTGLAKRQTAVADADTGCDARSHLRASTGRALATFARSLPSGPLAQLSDIYSSRAAALRVALRVLSASPAGQ